jgi:hypothetical protein
MKYKSCGIHYKIRPKSESILKRLGKSKDKKEVNNQKETGKRLMTSYRRQQDGSVDSVRQESQLYIAEDNKVADGSMDSIIYCRRQ